MIGIVERIDAWGSDTPDVVAHECGPDRVTYAELRDRSSALATLVAAKAGPRGTPVVVYGHKHPTMLVSFLAAVKAGHPYVPVDRSWPADRIATVVAESGAALVIATEPLPDGLDLGTTTLLHQADALAAPASPEPAVLEPVRPEETFYVIYTSGSTGRPKGVQISRQALESFLDWSVSFAGGPAPETARTDAVWLNQAPFSFDLSVMDLYTSLVSGATLHSVTADLVAKPRDLHADLHAAAVSVWVSTPSYADLCLADPAFDAELLPRLAVFWFCGETLAPSTARALLDRFPGSVVYNTYGPTESTVAVTSVRIDEAVLAQPGPLPVGTAKPGTIIVIDPARCPEPPPPGTGEVVIAGDTVSLGYRGRPDLTEAAFTYVDVDEAPTPAYRTGDLGRLDPDGMLHFLGRIDNQVKLHGYRIEIEDIENNLRRLDDVVHAAVVPIRRDGEITHLKAFLQLAAPTELSPLAYATDVKRRLRAYVPDYMVPKVIETVATLPLTGNGKVDRRRLLADPGAQPPPGTAR